MKDLITYAFVAFAPLYYLFEVEWKYQTSVKSVKELVVLIAVTLATTTLFFSYLVVHDDHAAVYYLLVFAIGGPFVDLVTRTYPSTGSLCHVVSVALFVLIDGISVMFFWPAVAILFLSTTGFLGSILGRSITDPGYIGPNEDDTKGLLSAEGW